MTHVGPFPIEGRVTVLPHAVEQARERWGLGISTSGEIAARIEEHVREAVAAGRVYDTKPKPFRLYPYNDIGMPSWQRLVVSGDGQRACVIALDFPPDVTVVTSLSRQAKIPRR